MASPDCRTETDSLGQVEVPAHALYGAQTARAVANFPVSGLRLPRREKICDRASGVLSFIVAKTFPTQANKTRGRHSWRPRAA